MGDAGTMRSLLTMRIAENRTMEEMQTLTSMHGHAAVWVFLTLLTSGHHTFKGLPEPVV